MRNNVQWFDRREYGKLPHGVSFTIAFPCLIVSYRMCLISSVIGVIAR